jgi:hypothetical protein
VVVFVLLAVCALEAELTSFETQTKGLTERGVSGKSRYTRVADDLVKNGTRQEGMRRILLRHRVNSVIVWRVVAKWLLNKNDVGALMS